MWGSLWHLYGNLMGFSSQSLGIFLSVYVYGGGGGFRDPISGSLKKDLKIICVSMSFENISLELFVGFFGISFLASLWGIESCPALLYRLLTNEHLNRTFWRLLAVWKGRSCSRKASTTKPANSSTSPSALR